MTSAGYLGLLVVSVVLAVTPGPDTMLSLRCALASRRAGLGAATGSSAAAFLWAGLAATGLAVLLESTPRAYELLSLLGGLYLVVLGAGTLVSARRRMRAAMVRVPTLVGAERGSLQDGGLPGPETEAVCRSGARGATMTGRSAFLAGLATCLTNPKVGLFFLALFPQFTPPETSLAFTIGVLGGTVALIMYLYLVGVVLLVDAANRWLSSPRVTAWVEVASGMVLLGLGLTMVITGAAGLSRLSG